MIAGPGKNRKERLYVNSSGYPAEATRNKSIVISRSLPL